MINRLTPTQPWVKALRRRVTYLLINNPKGRQMFTDLWINNSRVRQMFAPAFNT
ncbi:MAG: hypothetical protein LBU34_11890 [Planctomycetaceae bacterium]|nr:hypothetical protein [Planctomycetaceae bacterium]